MDSQRFEELLGLLLDGEPSREELVELVRLTKGHPAREREIQAQLEAAEMIALSEDELRDSTLFTAALQGRMFEDPFVSRVRAQIGHDTTRVSLWRRPLTWAPLGAGRGRRRWKPPWRNWWMCKAECGGQAMAAGSTTRVKNDSICLVARSSRWRPIAGRP
jgi:hypothetical protein